MNTISIEDVTGDTNLLFVRFGIFLSLCGWFLFASPLNGQEAKPKIFEFSGYVSEVNTTTYQNIYDRWDNLNMIHNRLNFDLRPNSHWRVSLNIRNRFFCGTSYTKDQLDLIGKDTQGSLDLSFNWFSGNKYLFNTTIDRLFVSYEQEFFKIQLGRQRINWAQCLIWNPNDLFNTYSMFDLDYVERPGTDAIRVMFFPTETSSIEFVANYSVNQRITTAAMVRFNVEPFDIQILGGMFEQSDYTLGAGFSGCFANGINFRGEGTVFCPFGDPTKNPVVISASMGLDYIFESGVMIAGQVLYNSNATGNAANLFGSLQSNLFSPKNLSVAEWSVSAQSSYTINPLFSVSFAALYYPDLNGVYLTPNITYNALTNLTVSFCGQYFFFQQSNSPVHIGLLYARAGYYF